MTDQHTSTAEGLTLTERIRATPDQVFDFLVEPDKLIRWMGTEADIEPTAGGRFRLNVTGSDVAAGTYLEVDRPNRVVIAWGWEGHAEVPPGSTEVSFTLTADGDETIVELVHAGLPDGQRSEHRSGWTYFLDRLARAGSGEQLEAQDPEGDAAGR